jgi:hypothetical protein
MNYLKKRRFQNWSHALRILHLISLPKARQTFVDNWNLVTLTVNYISQCCTTFLHSRHAKYCRKVMAAHRPHFAYCGGGGGRWMCYFQFHLVDLVCPTIIKKMKTETEQKTSWTIIFLIMIIIIMRGENFVAHLDGLGGTPLCRGTSVAHHWYKSWQMVKRNWKRSYRCETESLGIS